jgi:hypothetical protein
VLTFASRDGQAAPVPDNAVTKFENDIISDPATKLGALTINESLPVRDAYGTAGRAVIMRTNYFKVSLTKQTSTVYRYALSFEKEDGVSRAKKRRYFELLLKQNPFAKVVHYSDLSANLYTLEKLKLSGKDRQEFQVVIYDRLDEPFPAATKDDAQGLAAARARKTRKLRVELTTSYDLNDLFRYAQSANGGKYDVKGDVVQAINIIFNHAARTHQRIAAQPGNKFYPLADFAALNRPNHPNMESWILGEGLIAIRGYYSSVRLGPSRVLVNVNVATGAFYEPIPLHLLMEKYMGGRCLDNEHNAKLLLSFIKRLKVATNYLKEKDASGKEHKVVKIRVIMGFSRNPFAQNANSVTFEYEDERGNRTRLSVTQYYSRKHGVTLTRPDLPVINVGTDKEPMYIPPELCLVIAGQPARRLLSANQTKLMIGFAGRPPNANAQSIETSGLQLMQLSSNFQANTIGRAGLRVDTNMLTVPARILPPVAIRFQKVANPRDGSWNLMGQKFFKASRLNGLFSSLQISVQGRRVIVGDFAAAVRTIHGELRKYGITSTEYMDPTPPVSLQNLYRDYFAANMKILDAKFSAAAANNVRWILISIPEKNPILYAIIKFLCDVKYGINTVLVQDSNVGKILGLDGRADLGLAGNLALKFSIKSGGQPWALNPGDLPLIKKKTMVIGLDVTHPSPTSRAGAPSIAAIAWSKDTALSAWLADGMTQESRKEMISGIPTLLGDAIASWKKYNGGQIPDEIIVFRDGVSEGQFNLVNQIEFGLMQKAFDKVYGPGKHPKVSIIICGKRHHTRFYPTKVEDSDAAGGRGSHNPAPGLVVDRHITGYGENAFDLYLQPHKALQGTAKPCHYIVIKNETGMKAADLEKTVS